MKTYIYRSRARGVLCLVLTFLMLIAAAISPGSALAAVSELKAIDGNAAILVDARTGTVLYEQNADQQVRSTIVQLPLPPPSKTSLISLRFGSVIIGYHGEWDGNCWTCEPEFWSDWGGKGQKLPPSHPR